MVESQGKSSTWRFWTALLAVIVLSSIVLARRLPATMFRSDESGWISAGYHYADLLLRGDFTWEEWECRSCGEWGGLHLQVGKLLLGIPLAIYSDQQLDGVRFDGYYDINRSEEENIQEGRVPSPQILLSARLTTLVFGVLSCAIVFVVGYVAASSLAAGLIAALLLLTNPAFVSSATSAMTDIHYLFFLLSCLLAALWIVTHPQRAGRAAVFSGVGAGLACSVKVTGIAVGGLTFLLVLGYSLLVQRLRMRQGFQLLALFGISAVAVVYLLNPYYWPSFADASPSGVIDEVRRFSDETERVELLVEGIPANRYPQLARLARPLGFPLAFPRYSRVHDRQAMLFGSSSSFRLVEVNRILANVLSQVPLLWIMLLAGLGISGRKIWLSYGQCTASPLIGPVAFFLANYLVVVLLLKVDWPRYYLPTSVGGILLVGIGINAILNCVVSWSRVWLASSRIPPAH